MGKSTPFYYIFTILLLLFFLSNYSIKVYTILANRGIITVCETGGGHTGSEPCAVAKKALGGRSWNEMTRSYLPGSQ